MCVCVCVCVCVHTHIYINQPLNQMFNPVSGGIGRPSNVGLTRCNVLWVNPLGVWLERIGYPSVEPEEMIYHHILSSQTPRAETKPLLADGVSPLASLNQPERIVFSHTNYVRGFSSLACTRYWHDQYCIIYIYIYIYILGTLRSQHEERRS